MKEQRLRTWCRISTIVCLIWMVFVVVSEPFLIIGAIIWFAILYPIYNIAWSRKEKHKTWCRISSVLIMLICFWKFMQDPTSWGIVFIGIFNVVLYPIHYIAWSEKE
jgi:hypothetical protein